MPGLRDSVQPVSRLANRAKREVLFRVPPVRMLAEERRDRRLRRYADHLPQLAASDRESIAHIRSHGVHVTTLDSLALPETERVKQLLNGLVADLAARPATTSTIRPSREQLLADVSLAVRSERPMLDIAENYLGMPARYYGADVRREVADGRPPHDVRQWHRDVEDYRVLKILLWLDDVDADGGPFAYVPGRPPRERWRGCAMSVASSPTRSSGVTCPRTSGAWPPGQSGLPSCPIRHRCSTEPHRRGRVTGIR